MIWIVAKSETPCVLERHYRSQAAVIYDGHGFIPSTDQKRRASAGRITRYPIARSMQLFRYFLHGAQKGKRKPEICVNSP